MNALSGEAHAEENDPNGKVLLFSIDPNHKKFFAGRFLPEAQQESAAHQPLGKGMVALRQTNMTDRSIRAWPAGLDIQIGNDNPGWWSMASRAFKGDRSPDVLDWQQQNRQHMPTWAKGSDALNEAQEQWQLGTRFLGFLQTSEGMGQMAVALATGPFAPVVGAMGMDNVVTGLQTAWTGQHHSTSLYHVVNALGEKTGLYGPQGASYIEMALNIGSMVNPRTLTFAYRSGMGAPKQAVQKEMFSDTSLIPAFSSGKPAPTFELAARVESQLCDARLGKLAGKLDKQKLNILANNSRAQFLHDSKNNHINIIQKVDDVLFRITVPRDEFRIISVGVVRERNLINSIKNGRFVPIGEQLKDLLPLENNIGRKP